MALLRTFPTRLIVQRPSPTTTQYTVTNGRPQGTSLGRLTNYISLAARLILEIGLVYLTVVLLAEISASFNDETSYSGAAHGQLQMAEKFLDLLPTQYPAAEVARNRVKQATKKAAPQASHRAAPSTAAQRGQRVVPTYAPTQTPSSAHPGLQQPPAASPFAPSARLSTFASPTLVPTPGVQSAP